MLNSIGYLGVLQAMEQNSVPENEGNQSMIKNNYPLIKHYKIELTFLYVTR